MIYKFDNKTLQFMKVNKLKISIKWITIASILFFIFGISIKLSSKVENNFTESEVKLILLREQAFTKEKLIEKIKALNFRYPYIVYAQTILETGDFHSKLFIENNNLFGMKEAAVRVNTAKGTQYEHAYYDSWTESLYDYALYSERYLSAINNENEYLDYLSQFYSQDKTYVVKIKNIIEKENLKELFNRN